MWGLAPTFVCSSYLLAYIANAPIRAPLAGMAVWASSYSTAYVSRFDPAMSGRYPVGEYAALGATVPACRPA